MMEMDMEFLRKLPAPMELKEQFPAGRQVTDKKAEREDRKSVV